MLSYSQCTFVYFGDTAVQKTVFFREGKRISVLSLEKKCDKYLPAPLVHWHTNTGPKFDKIS